MENYIFKYYQQMKDGTIVVGKWILLIYEYIIKGLEEKRFYYDAKRAQHAIDWIEHHCFHTEGKLAPGPFYWSCGRRQTSHASSASWTIKVTDSSARSSG